MTAVLRLRKPRLREAIPMQFNDSRRDFLTGAAKAGAAAAVVGAIPAMAASPSSAAATAAHADLLYALGQRIGLDVANAIGSFGSPLSVTYLDGAGAGVDALREGIESGSRLGVGCGAVCVEQSLPYGDVLGIAHFQDPVTGRTARVEIYPNALSHIDLIIGATRSGSLQKQAIMSASSQGLYAIDTPSALGLT